jgi:uncharacterized protein (TIGR00251 family)
MQENMIKINIKVVPSSGMKKCILDKSGRIKCYVKSPPEDGAANSELIKMLAKLLSVNQEDIKIVAGATSRNKILSIKTSLSLEAVIAKIGGEVQRALF